MGRRRGILLSLFGALAGIKTDLGYPMPNSRTRKQARREDWATRQAFPDVKKAFKEAVGSSRRPPEDDVGDRPAGQAPAGDRHRDPADGVRRRRRRAVGRPGQELSGNSGPLVAAFAARLGLIMGQARPDGSIETLNFPVSERGDGDARANALTGMSVTVNPVEVLTDIAPVRTSLKEGLRGGRQPSSTDGTVTAGPADP